MPDSVDGVSWTRLIDTASPDKPEREFPVGETCTVPSRGLVLVRLNTRTPPPVPDRDAPDQQEE